MGNDDHGHAGVPAGVLQEFQDGFARVVVQGAGGFFGRCGVRLGN